jgi:hypothetical protein
MGACFCTGECQTGPCPNGISTSIPVRPSDSTSPYYPPRPVPPANPGWRCPNCGAGVAPWMPSCPNCVPRTITRANT